MDTAVATTAASTIVYALEPSIDAEELLEFYRAQHHPTPKSPEKIQHMLKNSDCFVAAREPSGALIGVARGLTDGVRGYLVECKLDPRYPGPAAVTRTDGRIEHDDQGIARALALRVLLALRDMGCERIDVLAYGTEVDFCEELGFRRSSGMVALSLDPARLPQAAN